MKTLTENYKNLKSLDYTNPQHAIDFISSLGEDDFKGTKTKPALRKHANGFLDAGAYNDNATVNGLNLHQAILCLIYDNI